ncbi:unnamed protein product [Rotaria sp. Silwood1]|nr:unnamed protein product [Rotaria sp. Silwood1]CAF1617932.1 unnamed protein product [Rotaria sp. Silwood1]CAF3769858.1 unnamed protein product [Rotaria sp. Silwood1]
MNENLDDTTADPMTKNYRFVDTAIAEKHPQVTHNTINYIEVDLGPIERYAKEPLLPLVDACASLIGIVDDLLTYIQLALNKTLAEPADELTVDESASIRLYTIEWKGSHQSLYSKLNRTLKAADREELQPYFKYLKLFLTVLAKLPCFPPITIWRGVTKDLALIFPSGKLVTW